KEGTVETEEESTIGLINIIKARMPLIIDAIPNFDSFPLELKVPIVSSWFRGSIKKNHNTVKLINAGNFIEASKEFLRHDEYLHAEERNKRGIIKRMDATSQALADYGEKKYKVEEQLETILPADKDDIIVKEEKTKKKIFEKLLPEQTVDAHSYLRERYEFSDVELDQGIIAGDEILEDEIVLRTDQPAEKVIDETWGQSEENFIAPQVIDHWKKLPPEKKKHPAWNWRQDSFLDTEQWQDLKSGWFDENILGLAYAAIAHQETLFDVDTDYNVYRDEKYKSAILQNPDAFRDSFSQEQTEHILRQQYKKSQEYVSPFWYISGRVLGGLTDPASIFLFSKAAKPIFNASRIKRATKTTQIIGAEELLKQSINEERTWQEGAMIIGGTFLINMLLPTFKGKMTEDDVYHIKNHINSSDLQQ
ncbi:uncharacterized protein METZ01_LOCUS275737, partial [marine metagenome]